MKEMLGGGRWPVYSGDASLSMSKRAKGWLVYADVSYSKGRIATPDASWLPLRPRCSVTAATIRRVEARSRRVIEGNRTWVFPVHQQVRMVDEKYLSSGYCASQA